MGYVEYEFYKNEYHGNLEEDAFNKHINKASRRIDIYTTGIDGIKKLIVAFPEDEYDANAVKMCACELADIMAQIEEEKNNVAAMNGVITREDGTITGKLVSSVSSGSESISYATSSNTGRSTSISEAVKSITAENELYFSFINDALSGVSDNNGVNLLYMGKYPFRGIGHV